MSEVRLLVLWVTVAALALTFVYVPTVRWTKYPSLVGAGGSWLTTEGEVEARPWVRVDSALDARFEWGWRVIGNDADGGPFSATRFVSWQVMLGEHALILILGGGLLTCVVRRERRQRAAA